MTPDTRTETNHHHSARPDDDKQSRNSTNKNNNMSSTATAYYGIVPALASTMCCWGPPVLGMMGAAVGVGSNSATARMLHHVSRYRPILLGLSATMIGYSFVQVYRTPQQQQAAESAASSCCQHDHRGDVQQPNNLQFQRAVVWGSLIVAIAGASYGRRVPLPMWTSLGTKRPATTTGTMQSLWQTVEFQVDGMACAGCANKVRHALEQVEGVHHVQAVDHVTGKTIVQVAPTKNVPTSTTMLQQAVEKAGNYTARKLN